MRAIRRHHTSRLKKARRNYWGRREMTPAELGTVARTPQVCSCRGCGNQRKYEGETLQEKRSRLAINEMAGEVYENN